MRAGVWPEDSGLTNEELALADVLTGVPMVADYPSLNLGQSVMVYCYQLSLISRRQPPASDEISCRRARARDLLTDWAWRTSNWPTGSAADGLLQQRDTAMLHRLLHDIEKTSQSKMLS
jgi:tRNA/rRNA methyltransferase